MSHSTNDMALILHLLILILFTETQRASQPPPPHTLPTVNMLFTARTMQRIFKIILLYYQLLLTLF